MLEAVESLLCAKGLWDRASSGVPALCANFGSCKAPQGWQKVQCSDLLSSIRLAEGWRSQTSHCPAPHPAAWLRGCNTWTDNTSLHRETCSLHRASKGARRDHALKCQVPRSSSWRCARCFGNGLVRQVWGFACSPGLGRISCAPWLMTSLNPFWGIPGQC